jgi:hypothetical protein
MAPAKLSERLSVKHQPLLLPSTLWQAKSLMAKPTTLEFVPRISGVSDLTRQL